MGACVVKYLTYKYSVDFAMQILIRQLRPEDMPTFHFYSSRIRQVYFEMESPLVQMGEFAGNVVPLPSSAVLFPLLRTLTWMRRGKSTAGNLDFIIDGAGDNLTEMDGAVAHVNEPNFVAALEQRVRQLTVLSLWTGDGLGAAPSTEWQRGSARHFLRDVLPHAQNLRQLQLRESFQSTFNVWDVLPLLPCLSKLSVHCAPQNPDVPSRPVISHSLTAVWIDTHDVRGISPILNRLRFPKLGTLCIKVFGNFSVPIYRALLQSVVLACADAPLTSLIIRSEGHDYIFPANDGGRLS